MSEVKFELG